MANCYLVGNSNWRRSASDLDCSCTTSKEIEVERFLLSLSLPLKATNNISCNGRDKFWEINGRVHDGSRIQTCGLNSQARYHQGSPIDESRVLQVLTNQQMARTKTLDFLLQKMTRLRHQCARRWNCQLCWRGWVQSWCQNLAETVEPY